MFHWPCGVGARLEKTHHGHEHGEHKAEQGYGLEPKKKDEATRASHDASLYPQWPKLSHQAEALFSKAHSFLLPPNGRAAVSPTAGPWEDSADANDSTISSVTLKSIVLHVYFISIFSCVYVGGSGTYVHMTPSENRGGHYVHCSCSYRGVCIA